jgi:hypothetical protein
MPVAELGDLGQVGNADDLVMFRKIGQFFPHDFGHATADSRINLIEYDGFNRIGFGQKGF